MFQFIMLLGISDQIFLPALLILSCLALTLAVLVFFVLHRRKTRLKPVLSEIDILNALKDSKVFPVDYSNGWKLYDYVNGQQLWSHDLQMPPSQSQPPPSTPSPSSPAAAAAATEQKQQQQGEMRCTVYACFSKVKGSPQMVLNLLKDIQKHDHWTLHPRPLLRSDSLPADLQSTRNHSVVTNTARQLPPSVCHDVISIQATDRSTSSTSSSSSCGLFRRLLQGLRTLPLLRLRPSAAQVATIQRFWQREENGCCWLLEYETEAEEWNFCLMQPIEGWFETDRCMLTLMSSFGEDAQQQQQQQQKRRRGQQEEHRLESSGQLERMVVKICSIRDYLQHRRIQTIPLVRLSLAYADADTTTTPDGSSSGALLMTSSDGWRSKESMNKSSSSSSLSKDPLQDVSLLQKFKNMIELKRESYEVEKRRKATRAMSSASVGTLTNKQNTTAPSSISSSIQNPFDLLRKLSVSKSFDQGRGGAGGGKVDPGGEAKRPTEQGAKEQRTAGAMKDIPENGRKEEKDQRSSGGVSGNAVLRRRMPLLNEIGRSRSVKSSDIQYKEAEFNERGEEKEEVVDEEKKNRGPSSVEETTATVQSPDSIPQPNKDSELESRLKLIAEATVLDLIAEKSRVSLLNITSSYKEQAKATGGWTYRGLEKDTVILHKEVDDDNPIHSYLGKGMVPASPMLVYEILRKPHNRKFYDNWLQKVQVLHEFESGLKIVYMYHEGVQSSKGNCHDLCLLQSEKCEGKRYIISLQSVEWPKCKELENVARVKMSSSGWIIEPVVKGKEVFSMITYITQMELGSNQGSTDYLDEFAAKQPACIIGLRQYVVTSLTETTSSDHLKTDCPPSLQSLGRNP